ncbi:hypothetical protein N9L43_00560 [bacterium]|nr:hypothetical protein [bacterium]MDB3907904.1 hypothetical protein [Crocinitomicaceae bacterium]
MKTDIIEIRDTLKSILEDFLGPLQVRVNKPSNFEVNGTIEAPQGKKMVDGIYFSSVVPKDKDVRFYFYPAYTHPQEFENLSDTLKKFKKGKSCFHVKFLNEELENEIKDLLFKAIEVYRKEGWLE